MQILIAIDSFKGSLRSITAGKAVEAGIRAVYPQAKVIVLPVADGGEGTMETLATAIHAEIRTRSVTGPCGAPVLAKYAVSPDGTSAVFDMAEAAGFTLVPPAKRNPLLTTTAGVGELILAGIADGCHRILIGLGGSATVDLGLGMARALGARFFDVHGGDIPDGGNGLAHLHRIDLSGLDFRLSQTEIIGLHDVRHCLREGIRTFSPQKGATPADVQTLLSAIDRALPRFQAIYPPDIGSLPGGGAAGGLGAGLVMFLKAKLRPGAPYILDWVGFDQQAAQSDIIITGEGYIDQTTAGGKLVQAITTQAKQHHKPVIAFCGGYDPDSIKHLNIDAVFPILTGVMSLPEAMASAAQMLEATAAHVFAAIRLGSR